MIIVELKGGIGNQLFQYATGVALAGFHNTIVKVDVQHLDRPDIVLGTYRTYKLHNLDTPPILASESEINRLIYEKNPLLSILKKIGPVTTQNIYKERKFRFTSSIFKTNPDVYLKGNWQSEKYFKKYENSVRDKISFNNFDLHENILNILNDIRTSNSISIHIRRGDYVSNKIAKNVLGALHISYYKSAVEIIMSKLRMPLDFFIFSDDLTWARENISFPGNKIFVESEDNEKDIAEFLLMSKCKHNIIANSSFSWWAAWLNNNPDKIVIAPKKWFNKGPKDTQDLIPEGWIKI